VLHPRPHRGAPPVVPARLPGGRRPRRSQPVPRAVPDRGDRPGVRHHPRDPHRPGTVPHHQRRVLRPAGPAGPHRRDPVRPLLRRR
ncbi:MAG: hypothetical protein AVDCRST_MAG36-1743, partial [uncultured Nocardioidaceae bacterium]